ncbi:MAG: YihY/virulence factor BrkB family protein [Planctomycetes bacterium]|nr:YihY/virulence factor BrkB family protein [Planctomycetota bacterium]
MGTFVFEDVWEAEIADLPTRRKIAYQGMRLLSIVIRGLVENKCRLRAAALTYATVFSLIPLLALAFAMRGVFRGPMEGKLDELRSRVIQWLSPANKAAFNSLAEDVASKVNQFVDNLNNLSLGAVGAIVLIFSVLSLLTHVEASLNEIWGARRKRPFFARLWMYWGLVTLGTIFLAATLSLTTLPARIDFLQKLLQNSYVVQFLHFMMPYFVTCCVFSLIYKFMPSAHVRMGPAVVGGLLAGILWELSKDVYFFYVTTMLVNADTYVKVYSGMAAIPLFLIWVYLSWILFLLGAEISFSFQHVETYRLERKAKGVSYLYRETLALRIMLLVARDFLEARISSTTESLARETQSSLRLIADLTHELCRAGLLIETAQPPGCFAPALPLDQMTPHLVLERMKTVGRFPSLDSSHNQDAQCAQELMKKLGQASSSAFESLNFQKLAEDLFRRSPVADVPVGFTAEHPSAAPKKTPSQPVESLPRTVQA